jgi:hypothetical protein
MPNTRKFNFDKGVEYEVKEIIKNAALPLEWVWDILECPFCKKKIRKRKTYMIDEIEVLKNKKGEKVFLGYTKELEGDRPLTLRLPDKNFHPEKNMEAAITAKSQHLKEGKDVD